MKRLVDIFGSALALVLLTPVMLLVALGIRRTLGRPVLFVQPRTGLRGRPFNLIKFRTMHDATDSHGDPLPDEFRLTRFGTWLRSTSLDELPEFWNVLRGDMSLVGPRPLTIEYLPLYSPEQARRHDVKPGITGWAQVKGRNALSWEKKFGYDAWYVDNRSFWLDLKIILLTLIKVVRAEDVSQEGHATMEKFSGSRS
jgi:lipopolysaccharide/colanic/teichoic acid biosynthesis glycosyltransferase